MSSQNCPLITIGITAYNAEESLPRAIDSALAQTWPEKEIIIVDDCSSDSTQKIIETYINIHPHIKFYRHEKNKGVAASRNKILQEMTGEFIAFFDDDDTSVPDRLKIQYARIRSFTSSGMVMCHAARRQIYPGGESRFEKTPGSAMPVNGKSMFERIMTGKPVKDGFGSMATCSLMMPKAVIARVGLYDEEFRRCEDTDYTLRFALENGWFLGAEQTLVTQHMNISPEKTLHDEHKYHQMIYLKHEKSLGRKKTDFCLYWLNLRYEFLNVRKIRFLKSLLVCFFKYPVMTLKKIKWALPNLGFNFSTIHLHGEFRD